MELNELKGHIIESIYDCGNDGFSIDTNKGHYIIEWTTYPDGSANDCSITKIKK